MAARRGLFDEAVDHCKSLQTKGSRLFSAKKLGEIRGLVDHD